ncbi:hypothetical protein E4U57_008014 [Claviceps arundinis]|uniref:Peptidase A1 domain-containing protein n=1 Tax=Claviceps arundinis TaxID=1623583 RepID=A0A9P7SNW5_9HYPO|nr:hypothetical protein E4U57_008014 [Claviceps arundinis]KAG5964287.1 hypothetical protein E4U56_002332 [Claviceps arundinis]
MRSDAVATAAAAAAASLAPVTTPLAPQPVALNASEWLGIDGNWSTYAFLIGNNNPVNVLFSTTISEFWAIGPGGCPDKKVELECTTNRGGIYFPGQSKKWSGLGTWQLGLPDLGTGGSGQYGFDTIAASSPINDVAFGMTNVLMSAISATDFYLGYFGVGLRSGSFGDVVASPPLRQAVSSFGWIPSYSYGYTAGASYRGVIGSATLGGYDAARFVPHDNIFPMEQTEGAPRPRVRGIEISAKNSSLPAGWPSATRLLMTYNQTFTAVIDTTTPYLWFPAAICDAFTKALNLSYNDTLGFYTLTNEQYVNFTAPTNSLSLKFSFSSKDNNDNFGLPLNVPGVVNITLPIQSFVSLLQYPFMNATIRQDDPAVPYLTLRKGIGENFIIGNAFLQESYIITRYDSSAFSIHQARFPLDPIGGAQLQAIYQPPDSPFPPPVNPNVSTGLSTGAMVGIAVGVVAFVSLLLLAGFYYRRHRHQQREKVGHELYDVKDTTSTLSPEDSHQGPMSRLVSRIFGRRLIPQETAAAADLTTTETRSALEAPDCQIYELPAPVPPAELDAGDADDHSIMGDTDLGTDSTQYHSLTAYEIARRKLDRQLQGPVPEYTPSAEGSYAPHEKAAIPDMQPLDAIQPTLALQPSPISPARSRGADSMTIHTYVASEPSPVSPRGDWIPAEFPSPVTLSLLPGSVYSGQRSRGYSTVSGSWSINSGIAPSTTTSDQIPPLPASFQRTPIDQSRVVCLGPIPANAQLPCPSAATRSRSRSRSQSKSQNATENGHGPPPALVCAGTHTSMGSLGSNFTEEEGDVGKVVQQLSSPHGGPSSETSNSAIAIGVTREHTPFAAAPPEMDAPVEWTKDETSLKAKASVSDCSSEGGRIDPGRDLIHVPQVADKRYSWEEGHP